MCKKVNLEKGWDEELNKKPFNECSSELNSKFNWKCERNHKYKKTINELLDGYKCGHCKKMDKLLYENNLTISHSNILKYWNYDKNDTSPTQYKYTDKVSVFWKCEKNHEWEITIAAQCMRTDSCLCCVDKRPSKENNLSLINNEYLKMWDFDKNIEKKQDDFLPESTRKVWWKCDKGHSFENHIDKVLEKGCTECNKIKSSSYPEQIIYFYIKKTLSDYDVVNNFKYDKREIDIYIEGLNLGIQYDGGLWHEDLDKDIFNNNFFKEKLNIDMIRVRDTRLGGVEKCFNIFRESKNNKKLEIEILQIIDYININYDKNYVLEFNYADEWHKILTLVRNQKLERSLLTNNPELASEWHPTKNGKLLPSEVFPMSGQKVWWQCKEGHEWEAYINNRNGKKTQCLECRNINKKLGLI